MPSMLPSCLTFALLFSVVRCLQLSSEIKETADHGKPKLYHNVLFIVADDLRPAMGAYGDTYAYTPNMDKLAEHGTVFQRAYTNFAVCAPSRNSFMTGRLPDVTKAYTFQNHFRETGVGEHWRSLPQYFKEVGGYYTAMSGKVFHAMLPPNNDYPKSWSAKPYSPNCKPSEGCPDSTAEEGLTVYPENLTCSEGKIAGGSAFCAADVSVNETRPEKQLFDQRTRDSCIKQLKQGSRLTRAGKAKGFFVACGFHKPHWRYIFPAAFLKHYPVKGLHDMDIQMYQHVPQGSPRVAFPGSPQGLSVNRKYNATQNKRWVKMLRRANYGAISYIDDCIGSLMETLRKLEHTGDTLVVLTSDHSVAFNDQGTFGKFTTWESSLRVPLIIRAPWLPPSKGKKVATLAELVDLYATLTDLAGLPAPQSQGEDINGTSLAPVLRELDTHAIKDAAFSQIAKRGVSDGGLECPRSDVKVMGYSVRTYHYRYTAWFNFNAGGKVMKVGKQIGRELYYYADSRGEVENIAEDPQNADIVDRLHELMLSKIDATFKSF